MSEKMRLPRHFGKDNLCYGQEQCPIPDFKILSCEGCLANVEPASPMSIYELNAESKKAIQRIKAHVLYLDKQIKELRVKKQEEEINIEC